ncbi:glycine cleavage system protein GcvH [Mariniblastus fucicola]|uniref:Glycine cleavage system H protein n=1 Tax=Mariniblastus fucicola TaxID=980251 RepID=A0A5B9PC15_9BACT|nr:glycine cleavage system protein GcvH [Mariniblastus fucicola]QEG23804.1 Glycine cleavage system H protein [Mariniblastus fucicola]
MKPENYLFAESHEWANVADEGGDKVATVGISAHAVEALTDLVYMDLPDVGDTVTAGESFGEVESVKATSDMFSPVDGEIIAVNTDLPDNLETLNDDPYAAGWIIKVKLSSEDSLSKLMDFETYEKQCSE